MRKEILLSLALLTGAGSVGEARKQSEPGRHEHRQKEKKPRFPDLVNFVGVNSANKEIPLQLRQAAYAAMMALKQEYEQDATVDQLKEKIPDIYANEALRTPARQVALFKKYGPGRAANPEKHPSHLRGKTVDWREGNSRELYAWMVGGEVVEVDGKWKIDVDSTKVPPAIRHDWWPTVTIEPWHWEYVGKEKALANWGKHGKQLVAQQTHYLRALRPIELQKKPDQPPPPTTVAMVDVTTE